MAKHKQILKFINAAIVLAVFFGNLPVAHAASSADIQISGWIPYWASVNGAKDAANHIDTLDAIYPFGYSVKTDGTLSDLAKMGKNGESSAIKTAWQDLFKLARAEDVEILPTVMWSSGMDIERILSDKTLRKKHIKAIVDMVKKEKVDGVNIDYEGKMSSTRDDFSLFLKELKKELGKGKILSCAIEARTPPDSLYRVVPTTIDYANDFKQIGKYCDQVEIMTYDQSRADFKLNDAKSGTPYIPVADKDWVRKVIELAIKDIPKKKIILGAATYGAEYEVTVTPNRFQNYLKLRSVNPTLATSVASANKITPFRNKAGEMSFAYTLGSSSGAVPGTFAAMLPKLKVPKDTPAGDTIAQKALAYANTTGKSATFNLVWWSDAEAISDKIELAQEYGLKGVALFKIDGEEDPNIWKVLGAVSRK